MSHVVFLRDQFLAHYYFYFFINDLPLSLKNSAVVDLYADDTTFYDFQNDINQLETNLQLSLNSLNDWCRQNDMVINTDKTKDMLITSRQKKKAKFTELSFIVTI